MYNWGTGRTKEPVQYLYWHTALLVCKSAHWRISWNTLQPLQVCHCCTNNSSKYPVVVLLCATVGHCARVSTLTLGDASLPHSVRGTATLATLHLHYTWLLTRPGNVFVYSSSSLSMKCCPLFFIACSFLLVFNMSWIESNVCWILPTSCTTEAQGRTFHSSAFIH